MRLKLDGDKQPPCEMRKTVKIHDSEYATLGPRGVYEKVGDEYFEFCDKHGFNAGQFEIVEERDLETQTIRFTLIVRPQP